jgi:hypothetical protein
MSNRESSHDVTRKVTCHLCQHFIGLITSDGRGPQFETCADSQTAERRADCPMFDQLAQYQQKHIDEENAAYVPPKSMTQRYVDPAAGSGNGESA